MKFTNGYWLTRKKYQIQNPKEYHSHRIDDNQLSVYAPYKHVSNRGETLNLGMSTLQFSSPQEDIIKVRLVHYDQEKKIPNFDINEEAIPSEILNTDEVIRFTSGNLSAEIKKKESFCLSFIGDEQILTQSKYGAQGEIQTIVPDLEIEGDELFQKSAHHYMREQLSLDVDELVYGLGERFTPFIKNGQEVEIWNEDPGTGSEQAYKNIPFYISNKGYGVFVNHPERVSFEIATENVSRAQFSVEGESLEYFIIYGPTMKEVLQKYTDLTGKPALPPAWSFGLWLSTSFTTDYSEETVMKFIDGMQERAIPFDVFHFDTFWMKEFEWCSFEWDEEKFPDPAGMIERIHEKGLKVCLWINPYIAQKSPLYKECRDKGYFLKQEDGTTWQWDFWQAGLGIIDFTNPDARQWYQNHLERLLAMGIDSFKTDFGERIPDNAVYFDESNPKRAHNYYSYLYNQVVFEIVKKIKGENEAVLFARSATVGSQKYPVHWGGDNLSEYTSMAESLRGGLSFLLSGFGFWSHDIGGFEENATQDIYKRWTQFGLLSTHSRYHGNIEYRVPWHYGEEAVQVTKKFSELKNQLMPYLFKEAVKTAKSGIPMMRPVFLEHEDDPTTFHIDKQYYLGEDILVAPIFNEEGTAQYYLPKGNWTHLLSNEVVSHTQGTWFKESYDYFSLPVYVREESVIVSGATCSTASYDYTKDVTISIYQLVHEKDIEVYSVYGKKCAMVNVRKTEDAYQLKLSGFNGHVTIKIYEADTQRESVHTVSKEDSIIIKC